MPKRIAQITLHVHVRVPDEYSDGEVEAIRSRLAHYDIRGGLREVIQNAVYVATTDRSVRQMERDVEIDIDRKDRHADLCAAVLTEDHPAAEWTGF